MELSGRLVVIWQSWPAYRHLSTYQQTRFLRVETGGLKTYLIIVIFYPQDLFSSFPRQFFQWSVHFGPQKCTFFVPKHTIFALNQKYLHMTEFCDKYEVWLKSRRSIRDILVDMLTCRHIYCQLFTKLPAVQQNLGFGACTSLCGQLCPALRVLPIKGSLNPHIFNQFCKKI